MKSFPDRLKWNTNCTSKHTNKTGVPREFSHQKIHRIFLLIWPWGNFNSQLISSARIAFISALARFSDRLLCVNGDHKNFVHLSRFDSFPVKRKKKDCLLQSLVEVKRAWRVRQLILHIDFIPKVIPLELFLDHSQFRKSQEGLKNGQSYDANFDHMDSPNGFTRIFIRATRMERLSTQELDTMSKNNLRGITLVISPMWGIDTLTLHALLQKYINNDYTVLLSRFITWCRMAAGYQMDKDLLFRHRGIRK